ncbi:HNH endonuclease [Streptomyces sp. NPDC059881]|uniref:HNH endonuclease n=1 Tax=Streptomyces sp. NPDC059881 TaxID=3346986 RepID=UPI00364AC9B4
MRFRPSASAIRYSFAESGEHHEYGGLLLRRDLHRLFDLGDITVDPTTDCLDVREGIRAYPLYSELHRKSLQLAVRAQHRVWLGAHWDLHRGAARH